MTRLRIRSDFFDLTEVERYIPNRQHIKEALRADRVYKSDGSVLVVNDHPGLAEQ